jgi:cytochrome c biogenesis protein CcmG, thiol:disulfide interchange protein DsbE
VASQFSVRAIDGRSINLADYKGKVILINFWATWCTPCQTEMPRFVAFQRELGPKGLQVIGISMDDDVAPVRAFTAKLKPNYPIAMGTTKLAESYGGVLGLPITLLIDRQGNIAKRYEGAVDLDAMKNDIQKLLNN